MKKVITAGLSFAMAASMLAGCSSKPAENSDSGDKRVLKFDSFSGGNGEEVFTKLAKAFEKANPDVDVQLRFEKELPDVLNKENAKGEYSDVVYYSLIGDYLYRPLVAMVPRSQQTEIEHRPVFVRNGAYAFF